MKCSFSKHKGSGALLQGHLVHIVSRLPTNKFFVNGNAALTSTPRQHPTPANIRIRLARRQRRKGELLLPPAWCSWASHQGWEISLKQASPKGGGYRHSELILLDRCLTPLHCVRCVQCVCVVVVECGVVIFESLILKGCVGVSLQFQQGRRCHRC